MNQKPKILLIDDDVSTLVCSKRYLNQLDQGLQILTETELSKSLSLIKKSQPEVVILDLCLRQLEGVESGFRALSDILSIDNTIRVIVLTGYSSDEYGIRCLAQGAANFLSKPVCYEHLIALIHDGVQQAELKRAYQKLLSNDQSQLSKLLLGSSQFNQELIKSVDFAAKTEQSVLITGETGTGKGYLADLIHRFGKRSNQKFVKLQPIFSNSDLVSSELFGHSKGSFTGAIQERSGLFKEAHLGTLFLDEIDAFSHEIQVALLGVLQNKKFRPLGSNSEQSSDFRLISATNQNIELALEKKSIRQDLFFRLAQFRIDLKPLRERLEDIPDLADYLLSKSNPSQFDSGFSFTSDAYQKLLNYEWPGNIRELESVILQAKDKANYKTRTEIQADDIQHSNQQTVDQKSFHQQVSVFKARLIKSALVRNNNSKAKAARELGIDRGTLQRILQVK